MISVARHLLYWMIEGSPCQGWQDETLGVKVEELFRLLRNRLSAGSLPHYFIRKSNMLAGLPQYKLQKTNERIYRIKENFVFFLIHTLKARKSFNLCTSCIITGLSSTVVL